MLLGGHGCHVAAFLQHPGGGWVLQENMELRHLLSSGRPVCGDWHRLRIAVARLKRNHLAWAVQQEQTGSLICPPANHTKPQTSGLALPERAQEKGKNCLHFYLGARFPVIILVKRQIFLKQKTDETVEDKVLNVHLTFTAAHLQKARGPPRPILGMLPLLLLVTQEATFQRKGRNTGWRNCGLQWAPSPFRKVWPCSDSQMEMRCKTYFISLIQSIKYCTLVAYLQEVCGIVF